MGVMYEVNQSTGAVGDPVLDSSTGSGGGGGLTQEEHDALMSLAAYEPNMYDVNPSQLTSTAPYVCTNTTYKQYIPVCGYNKISLYGNGTSTWKYKICFMDGTETSETTFASGAWTNYIDIPDYAIYICIENNSGSAALSTCYYSLLTTDSPYNPDNQNP